MAPIAMIILDQPYPGGVGQVAHCPEGSGQVTYGAGQGSGQVICGTEGSVNISWWVGLGGGGDWVNSSWTDPSHHLHRQPPLKTLTTFVLRDNRKDA